MNERNTLFWRGGEKEIRKEEERKKKKERKKEERKEEGRKEEKEQERSSLRKVGKTYERKKFLIKCSLLPSDGDHQWL